MLIRTVNVETGEETTREPEHGELPPPLTAAEIKAEAKRQAQLEIDEIEVKTKMNRAVREFMLLAIEEKAASVGVTPELLYTQNAAYKAVKDTDTQVSILRKKLK